MKRNRLMSGLLIVMLMVLSFGGAAFAEEQDIVDIAVGDENFSILVEALTEADLVSALQAEGPFTVFAPTNDAFAALLEDLDITKEELLASEDLADILLYHVVSGEVLSTDLSEGMEAETLQGSTVTISLEGGVFVNESEVIQADIEASNGVIHVIDKVLLPGEEADENGEELPSIVEIAQGDENFSILVEALIAADLVETLQGDGPFTVFAPTNDAFAALLEALEIEKEDLLEHPDLATVLLYHVVSGEVFSTDLEDGMEAETVQGENLVISLEDGVFVNESEVTAADIEASNGVIHVINAVLVPDAFGAEEEIPQTGDIGMVPFIVAGFAGVSGLLIAKKRK